MAHALTLADDCLIRNGWICPRYVETRQADLWHAVLAHLQITVVSVVLGTALALPLAVLAHRWRPARGPLLGLATAVYTVPSLALFSLLLPFTGLSARTVVVGLVLYSLTILIRNTVVGLAGVPVEVLDAARGMGLSPSRMLLRVELPLALPAIMAGLRVATVSTVALTTVGSIVGNGGLGNLIADGLRSNFKAEVLTASVLCVVLAVALDLLLLGGQRILTPWNRGRARRGAA